MSVYIAAIWHLVKITFRFKDKIMCNYIAGSGNIKPHFTYRRQELMRKIFFHICMTFDYYDLRARSFHLLCFYFCSLALEQHAFLLSYRCHTHFEPGSLHMAVGPSLHVALLSLHVHVLVQACLVPASPSYTSAVERKMASSWP
jgi:hypothetical protein